MRRDHPSESCISINDSAEVNTNSNRQTTASTNGKQCSLNNDLTNGGIDEIAESVGNHENGGDISPYNLNNELASGSSNLTEKRTHSTATGSSLNKKINETGTNDVGDNLTTNSLNTNPEPSKTDIFLYTKNDAIPLKKRRVEIEILAEQFFHVKDIQTDLTSEDVDLIFRYYKEVVEERNQLLLKISTLVIEVDFLKGTN